MTHSLNSTFIALILKKCNAKSVSDFHSTNLCNLIYKLVSKAITNIFKPLMHSIISSNQSAFILGRLITDNIIVTYEFLHTLKRHKRERCGQMTVKLNMSKAYDRMERTYLQETLEALGFN